MQGCKGLLGLFAGHKYVARYSTGAPMPLGNFNGPPSGLVAILEASKAKTYHGDVCTRCGHTVNTPSR